MNNTTNKLYGTLIKLVRRCKTDEDLEHAMAHISWAYSNKLLPSDYYQNIFKFATRVSEKMFFDKTRTWHAIPLHLKKQ